MCVLSKYRLLMEFDYFKLVSYFLISRNIYNARLADRMDRNW